MFSFRGFLTNDVGRSFVLFAMSYSLAFRNVLKQDFNNYVPFTLFGFGIF